MNLFQDILYKVGIRAVHGNLGIAIDNLQADSRKVTEGSLFIAMRGVHTDGHQYMDVVLEKGAVAIVCEQLPQILGGWYCLHTGRKLRHSSRIYRT